MDSRVNLGMVAGIFGVFICPALQRLSGETARYGKEATEHVVAGGRAGEMLLGKIEKNNVPMPSVRVRERIIIGSSTIRQ